MRLVESSSSPVGGGVERLRLIACVMTSATGSTQYSAVVSHPSGGAPSCQLRPSAGLPSSQPSPRPSAKVGPSIDGTQKNGWSISSCSARLSTDLYSAMKTGICPNAGRQPASGFVSVSW